MLLDQERVLVARVKPSNHGFVCNLCFSRFTNYYPGRFYDHVTECEGPQPSECDRLVCTSGSLSIYKVEPTSMLWPYLKKMAEVSRMQKNDAYEGQESISEYYGNTFAALLDDRRLIGYLSIRPQNSSLCTVVDCFIYPAMSQDEVFKQFLEAASRDGYNTKKIQDDTATLGQQFIDIGSVSDDSDCILSPSETADAVVLHPFFELAMWDDCTQRCQRRKLFSRRKYLDKTVRDKAFSLECQLFRDNWWELFKQRQNPPCLDKVDLNELAMAELRRHRDMMQNTIERLNSHEMIVSEVQSVLAFARSVEAQALVIEHLEEIIVEKTKSPSPPPEVAIKVEPMAHTFISYGHDLHHEVAKSVRGWLVEAGIAVWRDKENLELVVEGELDPGIVVAINSSSVVCVCVSLDMAERDRYQQREIRHLITLATSSDRGVGVVLVCCDKSPPPKVLQDVCTAVVQYPPTQAKVIEAVLLSKTNDVQWRRETSEFEEAGHAPTIVQEKLDAQRAFESDFFPKNSLVFHDDNLVKTKDEIEVLKYIQDNWEESGNLQKAKNYDAVIARWDPIYHDELFSLRLPRWLDRPAVRFLILNAKGDLMVANFASNRFEAAFRELVDIAGCPAFSMSGSACNSLSDSDARNANIMLLDCFHFANHVRESQGIECVAVMLGCCIDEAAELFRQIDRRVTEIQSYQLGLEELI